MHTSSIYTVLKSILTSVILLLCGYQTSAAMDIVILGDSNIWLAGDSCNNHQGWVAWMNDFLAPVSCRSYARSGATWSNTASTKANTVENTAILGNDNVIYNQVLRLIDALQSGEQTPPSLLLISAGGNDAWFASKRPNEFDETVDMAFSTPDSTIICKTPDQVLSLPGAIRQCCLMLRDALPDTQIVLLTPTPMSKVEPEMLTKVSDIIEASASMMSIPTFRLDRESPISRDDEMREHVNTYDGIHTSVVGAERVGRCVADMILLLTQKS